MIGDLLAGAAWLWCLIFACVTVWALFTPAGRPRLRRSRLRRLAKRRKFPKRLTRREKREFLRLRWVYEHVDPYDPDAVGADETEGEL